MAFFTVGGVMALMTGALFALVDDDEFRGGGVMAALLGVFTLGLVALKLRTFVRCRVLVSPTRLAVRDENGERQLDVADIRWIGVAWARVSFHRNPSLLCPSVRIGTAALRWIDLEVDYGAGARYRLAVFDTVRILHELWPLLPWPEVRVDARVQAYMASGDGHALDPRDPYDPGPRG